VSELPDAEARRRIREDLDTTFVVEAAAGTGKTTALVSRIVALVRAGRARLAQIVAVTFTEKAAGEMKLRLRARIEEVRQELPPLHPERARMDAALSELEVAPIGTIHALCADLLRERPVEARIDPAFEVAAGDESRLYAHAFDRWFQRVIADPPEGVRRLLRRQDREGPRALLHDAGWRLVELRGFDAPWRRDPFDREAAIDRAVALLAELATQAARADDPRDKLAESLAAVGRFIEELDRRERARSGDGRALRDHDGLEAELRELGNENRNWFWKWTGYRRDSYGPGLRRADVVAHRDRVKAELDGVIDRCDADLAPRLREDLQPLLAGYEELKARAGKLDFIDLLVRTRDLVRDDPGVRRELQERFSHVLVDEFQDIDPLQAEILTLLSAQDPAQADWTAARPAPGKLFVVGDPKQSIYRFRRADVALYGATRERLVAGGAEVLYLRASFRSVPAIQQAVNAAFEPVMKANPARSQAEHVPLEPTRPPVPGQPAVIALPIPTPYNDWGDLHKKGIEACTPVAIAAWIDWLVRQSGWQVSDRDEPGRLGPVRARHVCVLFKRLQNFGADTTRDLVRALEARRLPHILVGGRGYHQREEVEAVRNALAAIEWPEDELSVYATLRGPFFSLADAQLLVWRQRFGAVFPFGRPILDRLAAEVGAEGGSGAASDPPDGSLGEVADALAILARLHRERNRVPIADTITRLLDATRAHAGIAIWPTGEQALANMLRVLDLARRFEVGGSTSFRGFVERLQDEADRMESAEAPVVEDGTDGVRIMTVHKAKGLEFPVVILGDPGVSHTFRKPSRHVDPVRGLCLVPLAGCVPPELLEHGAEALERDRHESIRLTYVAATRARDVLVVPVVGDQRLEGWADVLHPALYPPRSQARARTAAPGCPAFGEDSLLDRPARNGRPVGEAVAPGLHQPEAGAHAVVWWDPGVLALAREDHVGLRQQEILKEDQGQLASDASIRAHRAWQERRAEILAGGGRPSLVVRTVTEMALDSAAPGAKPEAGPPVAIERLRRDTAPRAHGKRFGTLVHAVLAVVPFDADRGRIARTAALQARYLGAPPEEIETATAVVLEALAHPLMRQAATASVRGHCRRETPVALAEPDGSVLDGVIDLAFREDGPAGPVWTVVDFKTDVDESGQREVHLAQLRAYVRAVEAAEGPARGVLLLL
jgi:ATP-dependent helicase/nuclease subunit A